VSRGITILALLAIVTPAFADDWTLLAGEDFARERDAPQISMSFAQAPDGPLIEVVHPELSKIITTPITIELRWQPKEQSSIDMSSFRATYGWMGLDITSKIREHAQITQDGLLATGAKLPAGTHRVTVQIADNLRRVGLRTFEFTVR
jgi:hypothetical protein